MKKNITLVASLAFLLSSGVAYAKNDTNATIKLESQKAVDNEVHNLRRDILQDAMKAVFETNNALLLLENNKPKEAIASINKAIKKLEITLKKDPSLGLKPIYVSKIMHDYRASSSLIKKKIKMVKEHLDKGELQEARALLMPMVSDISISTTSIPLKIYADSIKKVIPLIEDLKILEATIALDTLLNTLVVKELVIPLPPLKAKGLLMEAEKILADQNRTEGYSGKVTKILEEVHEQLYVAELLGYGNQKEFKSMHERINKIEEAVIGKKEEKDMFEGIKKSWHFLFAAK